MKERTILIGIFLIALILVCGISVITDNSGKPQERAAIINNHELNGRDTKIGGTVIIKYSTRYLNDCITDMESRGYVVKQVEEKSGTLHNLTVVVYERRK